MKEIGTRLSFPCYPNKAAEIGSLNKKKYLAHRFRVRMSNGDTQTVARDTLVVDANVTSTHGKKRSHIETVNKETRALQSLVSVCPH